MGPVDVGIIGGSGVYALLGGGSVEGGGVDGSADGRGVDGGSPDDGVETVSVPTPYGDPSGEITVGRLGWRRVAFLPRHGVGHRFAPHRVPYRANLWALRSLGVRQVVSLSAVGSLRAEYGPGTFVVPDQVVDRTHGRPHTFIDGESGVAHVSFADPYCPRGRRSALDAAARLRVGVPRTATLVVVNGPRFSSRAESREYQDHDWSVIGMTGMPEAALARELALCFTVLTLVTDLDAGVESGHGVTHAGVLAEFEANLPRLRDWLVATVDGLPPEQADCECGRVYADTPPAFALP